MLTSFGLARFKSIGPLVRLPLAATTALIGPNASGKTNVIEGLRLLSWLAGSGRLVNLEQAVRSGALDVRELPVLGKDPIELRATVKTPQLELELELHLLGGSDGWFVGKEELWDRGSSSRVPLYRLEEIREGSTDVDVEYNNFARGGKKPKIPAINRQAVLTQLASPARFASARIPRACQAVQKSLESVLFLDPVPARMRTFSFKSDKRLASDGSNTAAVLHDISSRDGANEILEFVRALPEQEIAQLDFVEGPRNDVMIRLTERFAHKMRGSPAPQLSDGTLRVLAIAAGALAAQAGSLLVVEELDNGVHPSRAARLVERLRLTAKKRGFQLLFTTHNPATLDGLPDEMIPDVVACRRAPDGYTRLVRLCDHPLYPAIAGQSALGRAATLGVLDRLLAAEAT